MGYTKDHTARTRQKILDCAGRAFRKDGYQAAGIDRIMRDAGLTRGGFYLHFKSKQALFQAVIAEDFDFTVQVRRLASAQDLPAGRILMAFAHYLDPSRRHIIGDACTMVALGEDVHRADEKTKEAYAVGVETLIAEMRDLMRADSVHAKKRPLRTLLATAVGAVGMSRAMPDDAAKELLDRTRADIEAAIAGWPKAKD